MAFVNFVVFDALCKVLICVWVVLEGVGIYLPGYIFFLKCSSTFKMNGALLESYHHIDLYF